MCFGGGSKVMQTPSAVYTPPPMPTKATIGAEEGVRLAKKERDLKEGGGLDGMKISLNSTGSSVGNPNQSPGGNIST